MSGPDTTPRPTPSSAAPTPSASSDVLARFRERCIEETRALDEAEIRFPRVVRIGDGERTRFVVSLQAPGALPSTSGAPAQGRVQLACTVEARLTSPRGGVDIAPDEWVGDQYLPPNPTSWTWLVTGTDPGRADALLQLRPAVLVGGTAPAPAPLGTVDFTVTFDVERDLLDTAGRAWGWVVGLVGFIAMALGVPITYRTLRNHGKPAVLGEEREPQARRPWPRVVPRRRRVARARTAPRPERPERPERSTRPVGSGKGTRPVTPPESGAGGRASDPARDPVSGPEPP